MHIEKNVFDIVFATLMGIDKKDKDTAKARLDLEFLGIKEELHLMRDGDRVKKSAALFTLTKDEKKSICNWLKSVKFLDGYESDISRCVHEYIDKITGIKSHDCHVLF